MSTVETLELRDYRDSGRKAQERTLIAAMFTIAMADARDGIVWEEPAHTPPSLLSKGWSLAKRYAAKKMAGARRWWLWNVTVPCRNAHYYVLRRGLPPELNRHDLRIMMLADLADKNIADNDIFQAINVWHPTNDYCETVQ